jgi:hypothetical protein
VPVIPAVAQLANVRLHANGSLDATLRLAVKAGDTPLVGGIGTRLASTYATTVISSVKTNVSESDEVPQGLV